MIAHLIGGPMHGRDIQVSCDETAVRIAEIPAHNVDVNAEEIPPVVHFREGEYRRMLCDGAIGEYALFVYEELPHQFVITVDAVPGADRDLVRQVVKETVAHLPSHYKAFTGGIRGAKVD